MKKSLFSLICIYFALPTLLFGDSDIPPPPDQGFLQMLMIFAICGLFFYLILWKPEQKRRKAMEDVRNSLKKGDRVTAMGILGTVIRVQENTVIIKLYDGAKMEVLKGAITEVTPGSEDDVKKAEKDSLSLPKKDDSTNTD
jgi:preprotein translocase subunit YajC